MMSLSTFDFLTDSTPTVKLYSERKDLYLKSSLLGKYVCPSIGPSGTQIFLEDTMSGLYQIIVCTIYVLSSFTFISLWYLFICSMLVSYLKIVCISAKISVYSYIILPIKKQPGVPVLLNFTATDNFFTCTKQGEQKILTLVVSFYTLHILHYI